MKKSKLMVKSRIETCRDDGRKQNLSLLKADEDFHVDRRLFLGLCSQSIVKSPLLLKSHNLYYRIPISRRRPWEESIIK
jgi:hypothetical protein